MAISLLGPLQVDGLARLPPRDRVVLSALAVHAGDVLPAERIADALWGEAPPASWAKVVQGSVSRLRKVLGRAAVETTSGGYRLTLGDDEIDVRCFERLVEQGRSLADAGEHERAAAVLTEALALWRGPALADLERWPSGAKEAQRLDAERRSATEVLLSARLATGHDVGAELAGQDGARTVPTQPSDVCPYKGLLAYDRDDASWFFGRDEEVARCLRSLRATSLLVVVGPSGSGRSSLVRAGIVPALEATGAQVVVTTTGNDAESTLSAALASGDGPVAVDQLEELFTAGRDPAMVREVLDRLADALDAGRQVVLVVRADQVGGFVSSPRLARRVEQSLHLLSPMTDDELREAVEGPARAVGLRLEAGLVELLVTEVQGEPAALPLLSHALAETWERREAGVLTVEGYRASGGIRGAVAQSAERLHESLPENERMAVRSMLLRLVSLTPDAEPVTTPVPLSVLAAGPARRRLLDMLARARLVTTDGTTAAVAHEAVARAWPRLRTWLDEDAAGQRTLRHLALAAEDWHARGRPASELYRGARLQDALDWRSTRRPELTEVEDDFLDAAGALRDSEQAGAEARLHQQVRAGRRLRAALAATAAGLVLALVAGGVALQQGRDASATVDVAQVERLVAQSMSLRASRRDLAALLALEAHRLRPSALTRGALLGALASASGFLGYLPTGQEGAGPDAAVPLTSGRVLDDGRTLLAVGTDGVVRVLDLEGSGPSEQLPAPEVEPVRALVDVSRDGSTAAEISWKGPERGGGLATLDVFDVPTRSRRVTGTRLPLDPGAVAVSPDGRYVAVAGHDGGRVLVYDTRDAAGLPELLDVDTDAEGVRRVPSAGNAPPPFEDVRHTAALAFGRDGLLVAGSEVGVVRLVDPATGAVVRQLRGAPELTSNSAVALAPDDSVLVTSGSEGTVRWDLGTGRPAWVSPLGADECQSPLVSPTTGTLLCGGRFGRVVELDLRSGAATGTRYDMQRGRVSALLLTPDQQTLVQLSDTDPVLARWRLDGTGPLTRRLPVRATPAGYSADGRLLLTSGPEVYTGRGGELRAVMRVVDARSGEVVARLDEDQVGPVWTARPGQLAVWTEGGQGYLVDVATGRRTLRLDGGFGAPPVGGVTSANGRRLLAWGGLETPRLVWEVWDLRTGRTTGSAQISSGRSGSLSPGGRLVLWNGDGELSTYDVRTARQLAIRLDVFHAVTSPSGVVAASMADGRLTFLRPRDLRPAGPPVPGTPGRLPQLAFSDDGRLLAARGGDGRVRLVDVDTRMQLGELELGRTRDRTVALRPDGRELAVPSPRGVLVWDLRPARWRAASCTVAARDLTREEWSAYLADVGTYRSSCA